MRINGLSSTISILLSFNVRAVHGFALKSPNFVSARSRACSLSMALENRCFEVFNAEEAKQKSTTPPEGVMSLASPLAGHTFSGLVEEALKFRFEACKITRVIQSLHLLESDYEHIEWIQSSTKPNIYFKQHAPSYVPGLTVRPFWRTIKGTTLSIEQQSSQPNFQVLEDWCSLLEKNYELIRDDFAKSMSNPTRLVQEGNNVWAGALTEDASSYGQGWKTLVLFDRGTWDASNVSLFPQTSRFLHENLPPDFAVEIFFAQMDPSSTIQPHSDFTNFVVTSHLAIDIPYSGTNLCRLSVGDVTQEWINGKVTVFDTSLMHDAVNESDKTRYILMFRLWHPDLSLEERRALQFIYDCLVVPELASAKTDSERFMAEQRLQVLRSFPSQTLIKNKTSSLSTGFGGGGGKKKSKAKSKSRSKGFGS